MRLCLAMLAVLFVATDTASAAITIQGESPARTNIPTAADPRAAGGRYLALDTAQDPPSDGWYATYTVDAPAAGVYRLDAVVTSPAVPDRRPFGGSAFNLSVNGGTFAQVAKSEPHWAGRCKVRSPLPPPAGTCDEWAESPPAWGSLIRARLDEIELRQGENTIAFSVDERRISAAPSLYRFLLDELTLTPTGLALESVHIGDPATNLGTYGAGEAATLRFRLNGTAPRARTVRYRVADYFSAEVAAGAATIPAGATSGSVALPDLPTGSYRATASLDSSEEVTGYFARLPARRPVGDRFGVTTSAAWLVPSSRLGAFAAAMKDMGAGSVREEISWPLSEPARGSYDTSGIDRIARTFHERGLRTLGAWWNIAGTGNAEAPPWAMSPTSRPLPADLRDGYAFARHVAGRADGIGRDALELWNEPDVDDTASTGDQHAAWVKAAALGIADRSPRPLISLPGMATHNTFQDVMLENDVARYADVWAFHGYPDAPVPGGLTPFPEAASINDALRRRLGPHARLWMTESGDFIDASPGVDLTPAQQVDQARYLVQATVQAFAAGTDKHFWFTAAPYCATGWACFGLLSRDFQPWPSYSAHAAMASLLGEATFVRQVKGLPANVSGYVFKDGARAVTVVWAASAPAGGRAGLRRPGRRARHHGRAALARAGQRRVGAGERVARSDLPGVRRRRPRRARPAVGPAVVHHGRAHRAEPAVRRRERGAEQGGRGRRAAARVPPGRHYPDVRGRLQLR